ncbi:MAG: S-ribosylhomocysteine lyase, partial [Oscillospiraceae bacterium]|nr:S-ribosylhomocysteine lyase [Oscillospiraceae bacterium]
IYVGPMGCRTGFYLITRNLPLERVLALCKEAFAFCADFSGKIPGSTRKECGNYRSHNLPGAKKLAKAMQEVLETKQVSDMTYPTK